MVGARAASTGSPTTPRRSCTGGSGPTGQHIELGIAETNLVGLLGELGATWSRWGQPLLPIGVLYDPFVERALEPWSFGIYAGGQSILVGTPSGVTLAPEGGAHQSITTPSIGLEQPGCVSYEPAFALDVEWTLLAALARLGRPDGSSAYLRLSTRPVDQTLAAVPDRPGRPGAAPPAGGRRRLPAAPRPTQPAVTIAAMGAMVPEALAAADRLAALGHRRRRRLRDQPGPAVRRACRPGAGPRPTRRAWILDAVFPAEPGRADGHRARRAPAHAGVPGRRSTRCAADAPRA